MANLTITSANAIFTISIAGVVSSPVQLQGFAADEIFSTDTVVPSETQMGVDGILSAGYTPHMVKQKIHLSPDSPSVAIFEQWFQAMQSNQDVYFATGSIALPAVNKAYSMTRGVLTACKLIPDAKKVLGAHEFEITWQQVSATPTT